MKNISIVVTDIRTIVVMADTKRYGNAAVMYEGSTFMQCFDYIRRATKQNHFKMSSFVGVRMYTDPDGRTMPWIMDVMM